MAKICKYCKKPIETPTIAVSITQVKDKKKKGYLHQRCLQTIREEMDNNYVSDILNLFISGGK